MADTEVAVYQKQGAEILAEANALQVTNKAEYDVGIAYEKAAADLGGAIVEHHRDMKKKALDAHRAIVAAEKKLLNPVQKARKIVKDKTTAWYTAEERKRQQAAAEARKKAEDAKLAEADRLEKMGQADLADKVLNAPAPAVQAQEIEKPTGVHYRDNWKARVVDAAKIPRAWLLPDMPLLHGRAKWARGPSDIPGVEFYNDRIQVG